MGRPGGFTLSQEEKDRIAATQRANWAKRRGPILAFTRGIVEAVEAGDADTAYEILDRFIEARAAARPQSKEVVYRMQK